MALTYQLEKILEKARGVVLLGYYGANNFGDDMMLKALIDEINLVNSRLK